MELGWSSVAAATQDDESAFKGWLRSEGAPTARQTLASSLAAVSTDPGDLALFYRGTYFPFGG